VGDGGEAGWQQHAAYATFDLAYGILECERGGRAAGPIHKEAFALFAPCLTSLRQAMSR
jgi:hypothetical protein